VSRRQGGIKVTMISRGVEISITRGLEEMEDGLTTMIFSFLFLFCFF